MSKNKDALYPFFKPYSGKKNVYISGPMTGYKELNFPAFDEAAAILRSLDYAVCSPAETDLVLGVGVLTHAQYLRFDFDRVLEADFLAALPGWEASLGALSEILVAVRIGTPVWGWENWDTYDRIRYERVAQAISDIHMGAATTTTVGAAS